MTQTNHFCTLQYAITLKQQVYKCVINIDP